MDVHQAERSGLGKEEPPCRLPNFRQGRPRSGDMSDDAGETGRTVLAAWPRERGHVAVELYRRPGTPPWLRLVFIVPSGHRLHQISVRAAEAEVLEGACRALRLAAEG